jgi:hypothetical protein
MRDAGAGTSRRTGANFSFLTRFNMIYHGKMRAGQLSVSFAEGILLPIYF